jgi:hypothetical protein
MKTEVVEIGMKVLPFRKSEDNLEDSVVWRRAILKKQPYLYVIHYDGDNAWSLCDVKFSSFGDWFDSSDFEPYKERGMKDKDVVVGMKVVPFRKTAWGDLSESGAWKRGKERGYLYVTLYDREEKAWILDQQREYSCNSGDFFNSCDFEPYKEKGMKHEDVKIGMKVVPHAKTSSIYGGLESSANWDNARMILQPFLYVVDFDGKNWILNYRGDTKNGDYFNACDFEPYVEKEFNLKRMKANVVIRQSDNMGFVIEVKDVLNQLFCTCETLEDVFYQLNKIYTS